MTTLTRRAALRGLALVSATAGATAAIAAPAVPTCREPPDPLHSSAVAELIADWKAAEAEHGELADWLEELEDRHPEIAGFPCDGVDIGFDRPRQFFHLGIEAEIEKQADSLRTAFGDCPEVDQVAALFDRLRQVAQDRLTAIGEEHSRLQEACGIAEANRLAGAAADKAVACFDAILAYQPASPAEAAEKSAFLLAFVVLHPGEAYRVRETLFEPTVAA